MKKTKIATSFLVALALVAFFSFGNLTKIAEADANWDLSGNYIINMNYLGTDYAHDMSLTQDGNGNLTGNGGSPAGANTYTWVITSGSIDGDSFSFDANYTATADAVNPQTVLHIVGTVAEDGSLSGTWSDNYQDGARSGTFSSTSGKAIAIQTNDTVKVTILKYVDGGLATAATANNTDFMMNANWNAQNIGSGSGQFALSENGFNGDPTPYQAITTNMTAGADYSVSEVTDNDITGETCDDGNPYALMGYTSGNTLLEAQNGTPSASVNLTNINSDKYIIVWNDDCATPGTGGTIGGDVVSDNGTLAVTGIDTIDSTATADNSFEDGWEYVFHVTVPTDEPDIAMKFADWAKNGGGGTIPAANNIRISSLQANNGNATILITGANTYSTPNLHMTGDLDAGTAGMQVDIKVEVKVPVGTANGSYSTTYGIQST